MNYRYCKYETRLAFCWHLDVYCIGYVREVEVSAWNTSNWITYGRDKLESRDFQITETSHKRSLILKIVIFIFIIYIYHNYHDIWYVASRVSRKRRSVGMWCSDIVTECSSCWFSLWWQHSSSCWHGSVYPTGVQPTAAVCHFCCWRYIAPVCRCN